MGFLSQPRPFAGGPFQPNQQAFPPSPFLRGLLQPTPILGPPLVPGPLGPLAALQQQPQTQAILAALQQRLGQDQGFQPAEPEPEPLIPGAFGEEEPMGQPFAPLGPQGVPQQFGPQPFAGGPFGGGLAGK